MGVILEEGIRNHAKVVARAWADPAFKDALTSEPRVVLRDYGFEFAGATDVRVVESSELTIEKSGDVVYFGIPALPSAGLGDEDLTSPLRVVGQSTGPQCSNCTGNSCNGSHTTFTSGSSTCSSCQSCSP